MRHQKIVAACALLTAWTVTSPTTEAGAGEIAQDSVFTLGEIEVNGENGKESNTTIEKISAEDMRQFNRDNVARAVTLLPGVNSSFVGGKNQQQVSIRGLDIKHVPLLLDGIPIYVPYDGYPDLGRFTTFDLSEVVVSKGFTSVLYGPNTMGGAINLVSRKPETEFEGEIRTGYSSGNTYSTSVNLGSNQGKWYIQGGASYLNSDYFPLSDDYEPGATEDGGHRDNSWYRDEKFNLKAGLTPNDTDEYAFSYSYLHSTKGTPPYAGQSSDVSTRYWQWPFWDKSSYYFTSKTDFQKKMYLKTRVYYDTFKNSITSFDDATYTTTTKNSSFYSKYDDYTYGASTEIGTTVLPRNTLKLALHTKTDVHRDLNEGDPELTYKDRMFSVGLEDTVIITDKLHAIAGVSYDTLKTLRAEDLDTSNNVTDFDLATTDGFNPQIGFFYTPVKNHEFHSSIAQKTRLPSLNDKYSWHLGKTIPNPDLNSEKSINYEVGYTNTQFEHIRLGSTLFYTDVTDYIQLAKVVSSDNSDTFTHQNQNIGEIKISGAELEITALLLDSLETGANYTLLHIDNDNSDDKVIDVPKHKFEAWVRYNIRENLSAQVTGEYNSKRYSEDDGSRIAEGFTVINSKIGYEFNGGLSAEVGINNLFDRDYSLSEGYPEAGRTYFVNLRYII